MSKELINRILEEIGLETIRANDDEKMAGEEPNQEEMTRP